MTIDVYVDGSFNDQRGCYGGGFVILVPGLDSPLTGKAVGKDPILVPSRNIAGELLATQQAMKAVLTLHDVDRVHIYHDYMGIAYWVTGQWAAKKPVSREYKAFMTEMCTKYTLEFTHVKGHSGNKYNELADRLAREGTFLPLEGVNGV